MARAADEALLGRTIAHKFVIESFLGRGAMGAVYKAKQLSLDKAVAIKVLHSDLVKDPTFNARFQREAKAASRLDHPNSVRVIDYGRDAEDGLCYIAMELLVGEGLFQILRAAKGALTPSRTVELARQILAPLSVAHEMGIVHRDLKPENIIVVRARGDDGEETETVKVCDFGMAKSFEAKSLLESHAEKLTSHGAVIGTPEYMSPEQGRGVALDARSDLYSVGVILYQMLTGKLPFEADTPIAVLLKQIVEEPRRPSEINPEVHPALEAICLRALKKEPADRFGSAREMRTALRVALDPATRASQVDVLVQGDLGSRSRDSSPVPLHERTPEPAPVPPTVAEVPSEAILAARTQAESPVAIRRRPILPSIQSVRPEEKARNRFAAVALGIAVAALVAFIALRFRPAASEAAPPSAPPEIASPISMEAPTSVIAPGRADPSSESPTPASSTLALATAPTSSASSGAPPSGKHLPGLVTSQSSKSTSSATTPSLSSAAPSVTSEAGPAPKTVPVPVAGEASEPGPYDKATVSAGSVRTKHAESGDVLAALPNRRFNQCYREGLKAHGGGLRGAGTLHLLFGGDGHVSEASFAGPIGFESIGQCIAGSVTGINVRNVEPGAEGAEVDLAFKPE